MRRRCARRRIGHVMLPDLELPDRDDGDTRFNRRREHAGRRVAHVRLPRRYLRKVAARISGAEADVEAKPTVVPHLDGHPQVEVVHDVERAARGDPLHLGELRRAQRGLDLEQAERGQTQADAGSPLEQVLPGEALLFDFLDEVVLVHLVTSIPARAFLYTGRPCCLIAL